MNPPRPIEIVGGGLAGLALGLALQRSGVGVTIFEAGDYPRHRVCGEFITGLRDETRSRLGLARLLDDARRHWNVTWFSRGHAHATQRLPHAALGISRHRLDERIATEFRAHGGILRTGTRIDPTEAPPGRVFATGRRPINSSWLGLKVHVRGLELASELEFHLGDHAYVGLCRVEDDRVNVCGLFRRRELATQGRERVLNSYLRSSGLGILADRIATRELCVESCSAVAGVAFDGDAPAQYRHVSLGDRFAVIPPFTGNGMAMAFESAETALDPLLAWARGRSGWEETTRLINRRLRHRFRLRLASAAVLHPFLYSPRRQRWLALAHRARLLPMRSLYHALH